MRKLNELQHPMSCLNRARDDEWLFVLLGRDVAAPGTVQAWIQQRIALGKNKPEDPQIEEARRWIEAVLSDPSFPGLPTPRVVNQIEDVTLNELVDEIGRRYVGCVVAVEMRDKTNSSGGEAKVFYRGGHTLALGLASKSVNLIGYLKESEVYPESDTNENGE